MRERLIERPKELQVTEPMTRDTTKKTPETTREEQIEVRPAVQENAAIVMPVVSSQEALTAWNAYQDLKKKIVEPEDVQLIQGKNFLKKSYWRKIATFFNLTVDLVTESHEELNGELVWNFACKATAPNGRSAIGTGSCSAYEKATMVNGRPMMKGRVTEWGKNANGKSYPVAWEWEPAQPNSIHNVRTTAETRAWNRAVSNLVGGGEVSAEEVAQKPEDYINEPEPNHHDQRPAQPEQPKKTLEGQITEAQTRAIFGTLKSIGMSEEEFKTKFGVESVSALSKQQASDLITNLNKLRK